MQDVVLDDLSKEDYGKLEEALTGMDPALELFASTKGYSVINPKREYPERRLVKACGGGINRQIEVVPDMGKSGYITIDVTAVAWYDEPGKRHHRSEQASAFEAGADLRRITCELELADIMNSGWKKEDLAASSPLSRV